MAYVINGTLYTTAREACDAHGYDMQHMGDWDALSRQSAGDLDAMHAQDYPDYDRDGVHELTRAVQDVCADLSDPDHANVPTVYAPGFGWEIL